MLRQQQGQLDLRHMPAGRERQCAARGLGGAGQVAGALGRRMPTRGTRASVGACFCTALSACAAGCN
ncbi:hypothetical protein ACFSTJ_07595 [Ottowia pentelensis]|uniref:hypothetical protein n=1 Tax=Ottowia pentelensis TaxID=511108 RepID=UPI00364594A0